MLRIISGKFKNRKIISPKGMTTRPTSERLREAVFNILQQQIDDAHFLDLFAGSGAMGIEAVSRGAKRVFLVDQGRSATDAIQQNIEKLGIGSAVSLIKQEVFRVLDQLEGKGETFDVIYVDPPYATTKGRGEKNVSFRVLQRIDSGKLLKAHGVMFIEESQEAELEKASLRHLELVECRKYGRSNLYRFESRKKESAD